jgi:hypothetical protein
VTNGTRLVGRAAVVAFLCVATVAGPQGASAGANTSGAFVALTYNVAGLPQGISGSDPQTNSPLISPKLNAYDVVLLQEDFADPIPGVPGIFAFHDEIVADASHRYRSDPAPPPRGTDLRRFPSGPTMAADGLNQLSRMPFGPIDRQMWATCFGELHTEAAETILKALGAYEPAEMLGLGAVVDGGSSDCSAQKGFTMTRLRLAGGATVDLYNLHGEAGSGPRDEAASAAGYEQLTDYILEHSKGRAVIVGGDTNLHTDQDPSHARDRRVWEQFQTATRVQDVCRSVACGKDAGVIDKFAFRSGGGVTLEPTAHRFERRRFTRDDGAPLSDHDPLAVRFEWRSSP